MLGNKALWGSAWKRRRRWFYGTARTIRGSPRSALRTRGNHALCPRCRCHLAPASLLRELPAHRPARSSGPIRNQFQPINKKQQQGEQQNHEHGAPRGGQDGTSSCRIPGPHAAGLARHLGQEVPPQDQAGRSPGRRHRRHLPARGPGTGRRRTHRREARLLVRALRLGAAPRGHPRRPHHQQRRRARNTSRPLPPSTAPCPARSRIRWTASWTRSTKPA